MDDTDDAEDEIEVGLWSLQAVDTLITYAPLMLGAVVASAPAIPVFIVLQKQFMSGFALICEKYWS